MIMGEDEIMLLFTLCSFHIVKTNHKDILLHSLLSLLLPLPGIPELEQNWVIEEKVNKNEADPSVILYRDHLL